MSNPTTPFAFLSDFNYQSPMCCVFVWTSICTLFCKLYSVILYVCLSCIRQSDCLTTCPGVLLNTNTFHFRKFKYKYLKKYLNTFRYKYFCISLHVWSTYHCLVLHLGIYLIIDLYICLPTCPSIYTSAPLYNYLSNY